MAGIGSVDTAAGASGNRLPAAREGGTRTRNAPRALIGAAVTTGGALVRAVAGAGVAAPAVAAAIAIATAQGATGRLEGKGAREIEDRGAGIMPMGGTGRMAAAVVGRGPRGIIDKAPSRRLRGNQIAGGTGIGGPGRGTVENVLGNRQEEIAEVASLVAGGGETSPVTRGSVKRAVGGEAGAGIEKRAGRGVAARSDRKYDNSWFEFLGRGRAETERGVCLIVAV